MNVSDLIKAGFRDVGEWRIVDGQLTPGLTAPVNARGAVYAFVDDDEIAYIGLSMMPADKRLYFYAKPGKSQSTNIILNALISDRLREGAAVRILIAFPGQQDWNGLPLDVAPGLETALINTIQPKWNRKGRLKHLPATNKPLQRAESDPSHGFWVYVNHVVRKARLHRAECSYCNHGQGTHGGGDLNSGFWQSFANRDEASAFMQTVTYEDRRACQHCGG